MRRFSSVLLIGFLFLSSLLCSAEEMITSREAFLLQESSEKLSTSGKDALCSTLTEKEPSNSIALAAETRVRVVNRTRFIQKETVYDRENSKELSVRRLVKAALVEVLEGDARGSKGWMVISYRDTGGNPQVFLAQAPPKK